MAQTFYCSRCHNDTFHFSAELHDEVCDACGTPKNQAARQSLLYEHDKDKQKAIAYIKALDYNSAIPFLNSMKNRYPDDSNIYFLHLVGITRKRSDYLLNADKATLENAARNWEILCELNADTSFFTHYIKERKRLLIAEQDRIIEKATIRLTALLIVIAICFVLVSFQYFIFIVGIVGSVALMFYLDLFGKIYRAYKRKKEIESSVTPFV